MIYLHMVKAFMNKHMKHMEKNIKNLTQCKNIYFFIRF